MDKKSATTGVEPSSSSAIKKATRPAEEDLDTKNVERSDQSDLEYESWSDVEEVVDEEVVYDDEEGRGGIKTLFARNISFQVERSDIEEFFKEAGQVVDVKFDTSKKYGEESKYLGFGVVEFATAIEAHKALEFRGRPLLGREIRLDTVCLMPRRPVYSPQRSSSCDMEHGISSLTL
ncbi:RRM domain-containing protein [Raphanus sativus]|nr:RRM domain-containing protein [Raphanus sativus]KAJ4914297.1 RRM domain-containing protein [Raphanus sativus]